MTGRDDRDRAFSAFVEQSAATLRRHCLLLTGSHAGADDLLQDSLLKVYLAWHRIEDPAAIEAYARRTITRTHISWWRSRGRREYPTEALRESLVRRERRDPADTVHDDLAQQDEMWQLLATLGPRQRAALVLRYYDDLSLHDVADHLGCSVGTAK